MESKSTALDQGASQKGENMITKEQAAALEAKGDKRTNDETSALEVYKFHTTYPFRYFLYIKEPQGDLGSIANQGIPWSHLWTGLATTWAGEKLGTVNFGRPFRSSFGDERVPVRVHAINGLEYHGTYYRSAGNYARVKLAKS